MVMFRGIEDHEFYYPVTRDVKHQTEFNEDGLPIELHVRTKLGDNTSPSED
jgi:hypothetical protein